MPDSKTIFIVDDHPVYRKGLAQLLNEEADLTVTGEAESVSGAIDLLTDRLPDLIILDMTLKDRSGLDLIEHARQHWPKLPVLVISMHDESLYAERVIRAGALGYITKHEMTSVVVQAVRQVLAGKRYLSSRMVDALLEKMTTSASPAGADPLDALSNRELEVFKLIGRGFKRAQIAEQLNLSVKTIGTYRDNIKKKLNLKTMAELTKHAVVWNETHL